MSECECVCVCVCGSVEGVCSGGSVVSVGQVGLWPRRVWVMCVLWFGVSWGVNPGHWWPSCEWGGLVCSAAGVVVWLGLLVGSWFVVVLCVCGVEGMWWGVGTVMVVG